VEIEFISKIHDLQIYPDADLKGVWNGRDWRISLPLIISLDDNKLEIPANFKTDFGSIPGVFRVHFNPIGKGARAFVVHDYIYRVSNVNISRKDADFIMKELAMSDGMSATNAFWIHKGVRIGGASSYKKRLKI